MERSIVTLKRLFSKDIKTEQNNVMQNICVFRVILFCFVICTSMAILNISRIFIVDHKIMTWGYMGICVVSILYFVLILLLGIERTCIPYISITTIGLIVLVSSTAFTYHVIILLTFPIVVASMYDEMRLRKYAFWLTVFCIVVSTYAGYYWGICDANMVLITCTSYRHLVQDGTFLLTKVNESPVITLFLYYVLPRSFATFCFQYLCNKVNYVVRKSLENAVQMEYKALTDDMTGAYNKNRLIELLNNRERDGQDIAVIYWDVNQLKYVNDNWGHLCGDRLITEVAKTIQSIAREEDIVIRYGGDEFLLYVANGTKEIAEQLIKTWKVRLEEEKKRENYEFPVSASVGYALGKHSQLKDIIAAADKDMYANKRICRESYQSKR